MKENILVLGDEYAKNFTRALDLVLDTSQCMLEETVEIRKELSDLYKELF